VSVIQLEIVKSGRTSPRSSRSARFAYEAMAEISRQIHAKIDKFTAGLDPNDDHVWPYTVDKDGYAIFYYDRDGKRHEIRIARWLLGETIGRELDKDLNEHTLHDNCCGSKACINLRHLRIGTASENHADMMAVKRGRRLTVDEVNVIKELLVNNSQVKVARMVGVTYNAVRDAVLREEPPFLI
jgi:hypothetical protein